LTNPRAKFFFPENDSGPDAVLPLYVPECPPGEQIWLCLLQTKLRHKVSMGDAIATTDPKHLYNKDGRITEHLNVTTKLKKFGKHIIRMVVTYPYVSVQHKSRGPVENIHNIRSERYEHALVIIDKNNAASVFEDNHLEFLNAIKYKG